MPSKPRLLPNAVSPERNLSLRKTSTSKMLTERTPKSFVLLLPGDMLIRKLADRLTS